MRRRDFFKGLFGAAVVAAIPTRVMEQIEKVPIETNTPSPDPISTKHHSPSHKKIDNFLYLYDKEELVGASGLFHMNITQKYNPIPYLDDKIGEEMIEYLPGLKEWKIFVEQMRWVNQNKGMEYFRRDEPLQCLIHYNESLMFNGDVIITECSFIAGGIILQEDIVLTGSGTLK